MRILVATLALLSATPALAQDKERRNCMPVDQLEAYLAAEFQEVRAVEALSGDGTLFMAYVSSIGTFTIAKILPSKMSCVVDFGEAWQTRSDPAPVPEEGL